MPNVRASLIRVALATVIFVISLEGVATVWLAVVRGSLFQIASTDSRRPDPAPDPTRSIVALNPYFGYSLRPGITVERLLGPRASLLFDAPAGPVWARVKDIRVSEFGTWTEHPVPYAPAPDEIVVAVFGSSVSAWLVLQASDALVAGLQKAVPGKRVVLLNFGIPAGKQPQQLLILSYLISLGQHLDLVINIDGFGEVTSGSRNADLGVDFTMPSVHMTKPMWLSGDVGRTSSGHFELLASHLKARERSAAVSAWRIHNRSAAVELMLSALQRHFDDSAQSTLDTLNLIPADPGNDIYILRKSAEQTAAELLTHIAEHWRRSSAAMALLCHGIGAGYLHVLPPNPSMGSRHFGADELELVDLDSPTSKMAKAGMAQLAAAPPTLGGSAAAFVNATDLFDRVDGPVYADSVHQNLRGGGIMADFIARQVVSLRLLGASRSQGSR